MEQSSQCSGNEREEVLPVEQPDLPQGNQNRRRAIGPVCAVSTCFSTRQCSGLHFHKFPKDLQRRQLWVNALGDEELSSLPLEKLQFRSLCDLHFAVEHRRGKRLLMNALPLHHTLRSDRVLSSPAQVQQLHQQAPAVSENAGANALSDHSYCRGVRVLSSNTPEVTQPIGSFGASSVSPTSSFEEVVTSSVSNRTDVVFEIENGPQQGTSLHTDIPQHALTGTHDEGDVVFVMTGAPSDSGETVVGATACDCSDDTMASLTVDNQEELESESSSNEEEEHSNVIRLQTPSPRNIKESDGDEVQHASSVAQLKVSSDHSYFSMERSDSQRTPPLSSSPNSNLVESSGLQNKHVGSPPASTAAPTRRVMAPSILVDYKTIPCPSDGNCFYVSVSNSMYGTPVAHVYLRRLMMQEGQRKFATEVQPFAVHDAIFVDNAQVVDIPFSNFEEYRQARGTPKTFATAVEVGLLSQALQRPIVVYQRAQGELHEIQLFGEEHWQQVPILVELMGGAIHGGHYVAVQTPLCPELKETLPDLNEMEDDLSSQSSSDSEDENSFHSEDDSSLDGDDEDMMLSSFDDMQLEDVLKDAPCTGSASFCETENNDSETCVEGDTELEHNSICNGTKRNSDHTSTGSPSKRPRSAPESGALPGETPADDDRDNISSLGCSRRTERVSKQMIMREHGLDPQEMSPRKKSLVSSIQEQRRLIRKREKQLQDLRDRLKALRKPSDVQHFLQKINNKFLQHLITMHLRNKDRKPKGRRYTLDEKLLCLAFMKTSSRAYKLLGKFLHIPTKKVLFQLLARVPLEPGLNSVLFLCLESAVKTESENDRCCSLVFDETSLCKRFAYNNSKGCVEGFEDFGVSEEDDGRTNLIATHVLVFMVQGMRRKWKQPIAYFFCNKTTRSARLSVIIKNIIKKLQDMGLHVKATVCDQGSSNQSALNMLKEHTRAEARTNDPPGPYFYVGFTKIFILFDVPHLFKCVRNMLMKYYLLWDGKEARFEYIKLLRKFFEGICGVFTLTKLSDTHVTPGTQDKMKMNIAAQTLSASVGACLILMNGNPKLGNPQSEVTGNVIVELDELLDLCNGPGGRPKPSRCNVSQTSLHHQKWPEMLGKLKTAKFVNNAGKTQYTPTFNNWAQTIDATRSLWRHLSTDVGFNYLNLRQLQQDCLENFFGDVKSALGKNKKMGVSEFSSAVKTVMISQTIKHSPTFNCEDDEMDLLVKLRSFLFPQASESDPSMQDVSECQVVCENSPEELERVTESEGVEFHIADEDAPCSGDDDGNLEERIASLENQASSYVAGYLCYRLLRNLPSPCETCSTILTSEAVDGDHEYIRLMEFDDKKRLQYPSVALRQLVRDCETIFAEQVASSQFHVRNLRELTITLLMAGTCTNWLTCNKHQSTVIPDMFTLIARMAIKKHCKRLNNEQRKKERIEAMKRRQRQAQRLAQRGKAAQDTRRATEADEQISDSDSDA